MFQPSLRIALAALDRSIPETDWLRIVEALHAEPGFWWLDSARADSGLGRCSFAGADPYLRLEARGTEVEIDVRRAVRPGLARGFHRIEADPIECARSLLPRADSLIYSTRVASASCLPGSRDPSPWHEVAGLSAGLELPFLGGAVGYFGYELARVIEPRLRFGNRDDLALPDLSLAFVDRIVAYEHATERLWVIGLGFGGRDGSTGSGVRDTAVRRSRAVVDDLSRWIDEVLAQKRTMPSDTKRADLEEAGHARPIPALSTSDASGYTKAVDRILEEIALGNVYQANFSQRLSIEAPIDPWTIYRALRHRNPAPFGAYLALPDGAVLSSSPERFLRMDAARRIESRPIKGTRPRGDDGIEDARLAHELRSSEKDRAENLMIVDLVRNDLGRVCAPGSIDVPELMKVEA
ncbi:MAG TPA: anthranilate synthase component I family protein, partial [Deltaproteobacteria bacterium]|nr:anthranilate synthase component I family protein [Deltaproteobacteria bacterium]